MGLNSDKFLCVSEYIVYDSTVYKGGCFDEGVKIFM